jgi:hypothetical protein
VEPADDFVERCRELHKKSDSISMIASVLKATPIDVSRALRRAGVITDVQAHERAYIAEKLPSMPRRAIAEYLGMSETQLEQLIRRSGLGGGSRGAKSTSRPAWRGRAG